MDVHSRHKEHTHLCVEQWRDGGEAGEVSGSQIQGLVQHLGFRLTCAGHTSLQWQLLLSDRGVCCELSRVPQEDMSKVLGPRTRPCVEMGLLQTQAVGLKCRQTGGGWDLHPIWCCPAEKRVSDTETNMTGECHVTIEAGIEGCSCEPRISRDRWLPQKLEGARTHSVKSQREPGPADSLNFGLQTAREHTWPVLRPPVWG